MELELSESEMRKKAQKQTRLEKRLRYMQLYSMTVMTRMGI